MGVRKLVKTSFEIYRRNIFVWLGICVFIYSPLCVRNYMASEFVIVTSSSADVGFESLSDLSAVTRVWEQVRSQSGVLGQLIFFVPEVFFVPLGMAVVSYVVSQNLSKRNLVVSDLLDNSLVKWKKILTASCLYRLIFLVPMCFVFPVVFLVSFYFYPTVIALSDCGAIGSVVLSHVSLSGHMVKAAVLILVVKLVSSLVSLFVNCFVGYFIAMEDGLVLYSLVTVFLSRLVGIFFDVLLIVWFLDTSYTSMVDIVSKKFGDEINKKKGTGL